MTPIVTASEMRATEAAAIAAGIPESELMRRAAEQIATWIDGHVVRRGPRSAVALVGPGNNGGDALVAMSILHELGWTCGSLMLGRADFGPLPANEETLAAISRVDLNALRAADVIIDGVYGIGGRPSLPEHVSIAFAEAWDMRVSRGTPLVAIDVPSGIDASTGDASPNAFRADVTLCLGLIKRGLVREPAATFAGDIELLPIGLPEPRTDTRQHLITIEDVRYAMPRRSASAHKSDTGAVLILGGAPMYYGAPRLAAEAALRAGAGLVALATPEHIVPVIASQLPEIVLVALPDDTDEATERIHSFIEARQTTLRAIVVGPGIGRGQMADTLMSVVFPAGATSKIWSLLDTPGLVIDADGLNWLSERQPWQNRLPPRSTVLTPHAGEMSRLLRVPPSEVKASPHSVVRKAAESWRQCVVLKAGVTALATPSGELRVSPRATPELATAGTGDVLAGMIGGFIAQGLDVSTASTCALWIGAQAGRAARNEQSAASVTSRDVIARIGHVMNTALEPRWSA